MNTTKDVLPSEIRTGPLANRMHVLVCRALIIGSVSACIIVGSWYFYLLTEHQILSAVQQLRQSNVLLQRAEQQLQRLGDASASPLTRAAGEDIDSVQIRLAEFLRRYPASDEISVPAFEQSILPEPMLTTGIANDADVLPDVIQILRLNIEAVVVHGPALLRLLSELEHAVAGWPVDVRACDIHRTPLQRLNARCVLDVYYWQVEAGQS